MKKRMLCIALSICILWAAGCGAQTDAGKEPEQSQDFVRVAEDTIDTDSTVDRENTVDTDDVLKLCQDIYAEETASHTVEEMQYTEMMQNIIQRLGEQGYPAIDSKNQIDMTQRERVLSFCNAVEQSKGAEVTILVLETPEKLYRYYLRTENGQVEIVREYYQYNNGCFEKTGSVSYHADTWQCTAEGYLIFTGSSYSEQSYVLTMSDVPEVTAMRVEPLDSKCRELNRLYMLPVGYGRNNMFLCDWNGEDYGELDFYDAFDCFYAMINGRMVPYLPDENISAGTVYQIPQEEFEGVLMEYLPVDRERIRSHTRYLPEKKVYEYRPRGFYEAEYTNIPYPEVTGYVTNDDGTVTLSVNAVYPGEGTSKAYTHEVVVRPMQDGGCQYLSNKMLPSKDDYGMEWHTDRLTEEEWNEVYEKQESNLGSL